jgi:endogenous inhibitor of DNA gyrase (YacG/DUF329 family)
MVNGGRKKTNPFTCSPSQVIDLGEWVSSTLPPYDGGPCNY